MSEIDTHQISEIGNDQTSYQQLIEGIARVSLCKPRSEAAEIESEALNKLLDRFLAQGKPGLSQPMQEDAQVA